MNMAELRNYIISHLSDFDVTFTAKDTTMKLSISLDTITSKKRAVHRFRAGGKSSHRRRRLALGRF